MKKIIIALAVFTFLLLIPTHAFGQTGSVLTLSEIMFNPSESNGEFIEIYNTSTTQTVNLTGFKIKYYTSTADNLVAFIGGMELQPGKYAVIIESDYDYNNGAYKNLIPADAIVLKISDASFGASGMANTTNRDVSLLNAASEVIDTYTYSADNNSGISDEKYIVNKDNSSTNWRNGTTANGTPGKINSVTPITYLNNLTVRLSSLTPANPVERDSVYVKFIVKNNGVLDAANYSVEIFHDINADSVEQVSERIFNQSFIDLSSNDSILVESKFYAGQLGQNLIIAKVTYTPDEKLSDNRAYVLTTISEKPSAYTDVVINEIMYAPTNDEPEWIELYNRTDHTINLKNWKISDNSLSATISTTDYLLQPGEYVIISNDATISTFYSHTLNLIVKSLPSLSNSGDDVILKSSANTTVDSVKYIPTWGGNSGGKSLERVSVDVSSTEAVNWGSSTSKYKATPSKINSVTAKNHDLNVKSFSTSAAYAEIGKSIQIKAAIENLGKNIEPNYSLKLFRDLNLNNILDEDELIDNVGGTNIASQAVTEFNFTVGSFVAGLNQFIVRVDLLNDEYLENNTSILKINAVQINELPGDLVVNEIMYSPNSSDPEWVELYNKSSKQINLKGYQLANSTSKNKVVTKSIVLNPEEYFVITRDSSMFQTFPKLSKFSAATFPTLLNTKDKIVILDSLNRVIDSLEYKSSWGGAAGKSLERVDWIRISTDSTNWITSLNSLGGTPGIVNSSSQKKFDVAVSKIIFTPSSPLVGQRVTIAASVANIGKIDASFKFILNRVNKDGSKQKAEESNTITLAKGNSLTYNFTFAVEVIASKQTFEVIADFALDQEQANNSTTASVRPGYLAGTIKLNEVMYNPLNGEPEWIELYNSSSFDVDLEDWSISDVLLTPLKSKIQAKDFIFPSKTYLVVAKDSTIKDFHKTINGKLLISSFANLNNDADGVVLKDSRDVTIDSLLYDKTWGTDAGKSLERKVYESATNDKSNWGFSKDIELSTPGKNNSVAPKDRDVAASKIIFTPSAPVVGQRVKISANATNVGKNSASFKFVLNRVNKDGSKQKVEESNILTSAVGASFSYEFIYAVDNITSKQTFEALVDYSADEDLTNNAVINFVRPGYPPGTVVLNEVMYAPMNGEPEWIELYNNSDYNIDLDEWSITDVLPSPYKVKIAAQNNLFASRTYLVIAKDSTIKSFHESIAGKFIVNPLPSLNNDIDGIVIKDSRDVIIDSLLYDKTWGTDAGKSIERIVYENATNEKSNWGLSKDIELSTPGKNNSVSPKDRDLAVSKIIFTPSAPVVGQRVKISASATNIGKNSASFMFVLNKVNKDGSKIKVEESNTLTIAVGASVSYEFTYAVDNITAKQTFEAVVDYSADEDLTNNAVTNFVRPGYPSGAVVLNEVMYAPMNGEPEWIELYNASVYDVDLEDWSISDVLISPLKTKIQAKDFSFPSKTYLVIVKDSTLLDFHKTINGKVIVSSFANLNNDAEGVVIKDSRDVIIDSLLFDKSWGGENGKSLERILFESTTNSKTNWSSSIDSEFSSPGRINSVSPKDHDLDLSSLSAAQKYAVVGRKIKISIEVKNIGKNAASAFSVKLYRDANRNGIGETNELVYLKNETGLAINITSKYDIEDGSYVIGFNQYLATVEYSADQYLDNNKLPLTINAVVVNEERNDLVINEIMYAPLTGEPEWIEIYNNSLKQINLKGYQIANGSTKGKVVVQDVVLKPEEYFVVAKDSAVYTRFTNISKSVISPFPTLSNAKDRVVLLDSLDRTIDSLEYKNVLGGTSGKSLERLDWVKLSIDSTNWKTSIHQLGATPGFINSISRKKFDVSVTKLLFTPAVPIVGQRVKLSVAATNLGKTDASFKFVLNKANKDGTKQKVEETNTMVISKDASLSYDFSFAIENILAKNTFEVIADFSFDEDFTNNTFSASVRPGYTTGTVYINEVMYNSINGEPEWLELYNASPNDVDLEDWSITDILTTPQKQIVKAKDSVFPKNTFLVIAKDSTIRNYHAAIPSKLIITSFANLNNDADGVVIKDSRDVMIDSVRFDSKWGGENGKSLERRLTSTASTEKTNWGSSKDLELSTPGRINSIAIKKYDLALKALVPKPLYPSVNEDINVGTRVINYGTSDADKYSVKYYVKNNNIYSYLGETNGVNLKSNDSVVVYSTNKLKLSDVKTVLCKVTFVNDEDTLNNSFAGDIIPGAKPNSVLITEVMYDPLTHEPEWVEILNASNEVINLKNWAISDLLPSPTKVTLTTNDDFIQPGEYAIATPDTQAYAFNPPKKFYQTKFGSLGNTSDGIIIYDFRGAIIDSFFYKAGWGGSNGSSLERISLTKTTNDSTNWTVSISNVGASPGVKNTSANPKAYKSGALVLNELLYEPESGNAEFVEFYNTSNDSIQVGGLDLRIGTKEKVKLSTSTFIVPPKEFLVLASDSTIYTKYPMLKQNITRVSSSLNLSNEGTSLLVKDLYGTTLDSVVYSPAWHNRNFLETKNKSLERLNPSLSSNDRANWSTSVTTEGATPGMQNSVYTENLATDTKVSISPNPFSPDNDGFEDFSIINFNLPFRLGQVQVKVFDSQGRLVRTLLQNHPSASNSSVIFDGLDDDGRALRMGIYIMLIEYSTEGSNVVETLKKPIVVARKL